MFIYCAQFNPDIYLPVLSYYPGKKNCTFFFVPGLNWLNKFLSG